MKIRYINHGIGYYSNNGEQLIELNKNLRKYPKLHNMVLQHELEHTQLNQAPIHFSHELRDTFNLKKQISLLKFTLRHPSALSSISPILFEKKGIFFNWFMFGFWSILSILLIGGLILI